MAKHTNRRRDIRCSFCGKNQDQARRLVAGPGVFICNECVSLCNEILAQDPTPPTDPSRPDPRSWVQRLVQGRRPRSVVPSSQHLTAQDDSAAG
jgi:ATP-dependent protease Clp ATPase subunit